MAAQPPRTSPQRVAALGLAPRLTEVSPHTVPSSRQSHPRPPCGLQEDQQTAQAVETSLAVQVQTDRADREGPQTGCLGEQATACVQGADPAALSRREASRDRQCLCLMGQSGSRSLRRAHWPPSTRREQSGGRPSPTRPGDPQVLPCGVWSRTQPAPVTVTGGERAGSPRRPPWYGKVTWLVRRESASQSGPSESRSS